MKREELKALGVADDLIDKIMGLHGTALTEQKSKLDAATQKATDTEAQLTKLTADLTAAQKSGADAAALKAQLEAATKALDATKKSQTIRDALGEYKPHNAATLMRLLDLDKINVTDAGTIGLKEQVDALKAGQPYLFADATAPKGGSDVLPPNTGKPDFAAQIKAAQESGNRALEARLILEQALVPKKEE